MLNELLKKGVAHSFAHSLHINLKKQNVPFAHSLHINFLILGGGEFGSIIQEKRLKIWCYLLSYPPIIHVRKTINYLKMQIYSVLYYFYAYLCEKKAFIELILGVNSSVGRTKIVSYCLRFESAFTHNLV